MGKLATLLGVGVGYVLGARAGRERYDQIEMQARRVWKDPRVQQKKAEAQQAARDTGEQLKEKASGSGTGTGAAANIDSAAGSGGRTTVTSDDLPLSEPRPPLPTDAPSGGAAS